MLAMIILLKIDIKTLNDFRLIKDFRKTEFIKYKLLAYLLHLFTYFHSRPKYPFPPSRLDLSFRTEVKCSLLTDFTRATLPPQPHAQAQLVIPSQQHFVISIILITQSYNMSISLQICSTDCGSH